MSGRSVDNGGGSWQGDAQQIILVACGLLQQASAADTEGATDVALRLYQEACTRLDVATPLVPAMYQSVLLKHVNTARQRVTVLKKEKQLGGHGAVAVGADLYPQFNMNFVVIPLPPYDDRPGLGEDAPPTAPILRPFWLMRKLSASIQGAAWITPSLHATKAIWLQDGATTVIAGIPAKVKYLTALCELLEDVQLLSHHDQAKLIRGIDRFVAGAETHFATFAQEVGKDHQHHHRDPTASGVDGTGSGASGGGGSGDGSGGTGGDPVVPQRSKWNIGMRELLHKGQNVLKGWKQHQDATYSSYLAWAVNILEQAQVFDRWIQTFTGGTGTHSSRSGLSSPSSSGAPASPLTPSAASVQQGMVERLHRVATLFYTGPCRFLLADLFLLVDRYTEKSRESLSRLLPVNIVLKDKETPAAAVAPSAGGGGDQ